MNADEIAALLAVPAASRVDRRVPKTLLSESGAATAADRRLVSSAIESLSWVAALKPTNCGIAAYRDDVREYAELQVLRLELRGGPVRERLRTVVHRAIPYPILLFSIHDAVITVSAAPIRWSQGTSGKTVLSDPVDSAQLPVTGLHDQAWTGLYPEFALTAQPTRDLATLYDGWRELILALRIAARTGRFARVHDPDRISDRRLSLASCATIEREIAQLRATARRSRQMSRQVELTAQLRRLEMALSTTIARL